MAEAFAEVPAGTPLLPALRMALRASFDRLPAEKRELEEVRMRLGHTVPEIRSALRDAFSVGVIAEQLAPGIGRDPGDPDVLLFAGVVAGARLAAQEAVRVSPGRSYIEALDTMLGGLEGGLPLADLPVNGAAGA